MHRSRSFGSALSPLSLTLLAVLAVSAVAFAALLPAREASAQAETPPDLGDFQKVVLAQGTELGEVMELTVAPDGRVFFINRAGDILVYQPGTRTTKIAINNPSLGVWSGLEDGGLGITLDPNFEQNNFIYVYYAPLPESYTNNRLSRFTVNPDNTIDKSSEKKLLEVGTQRNICCHSAGSLQFGPDGLLYLSTGDNTSSSDNGGFSPHDERPGRSDYDAQKSSSNTNDLRGKIIRIDPRTDAAGEVDAFPGDEVSYDVPDGNLFGAGGKYPGADPAKTRPEIFVMGLRNPYRLGLDQDTGTLYWGEVGPDSRSNDPNRGPRHFEEYNRTDKAMNGGWPYCGGFVGQDLANQDFGGAYVDWNFTNFPGEPRRNADGSLKRFPCNDPSGMRNVNDSPNSSGLQDLPPMTNPLIPYSDVGPYMYPEVQGGTPTGGQVYRQSQNTDAKDTAFPAYYEGSYFISEMSRGWVKEVRLDAQGKVQSINPFMEGFYGPGDMEFGPDGSMYVLEYGSSFFSGSPDTKLVRVDYVANGRAPDAKASADKTEGPAPLTVNFSSAGTKDDDPGDTLTYEWNFGDGSAGSGAQNPTHTYEQPGDYQATLTVTDQTGRSSTAQVIVTVGNTKPKVNIELPIEGGFFDSGDEIRFRINVTDAEDGQIDCSRVNVQEGFGHDSHVHPGLGTNGCQGILKTAASSDHGPEANTYGVISARYTDNGVGTGDARTNEPLTGQDTVILQPKLRQAEHAAGRQGVGFTGYDDKSGTKPGGGALITGMGQGNWISFNPMSLSRMESLDLTYSGNPGGGARVELRAGSPTGPVAATVPLAGNSGGLYFYKTVSAQITSRAADAGGRPLFFVYAGSGEINFDEMRFRGTGVAANVPPTITSATATPNDGPVPFEVSFAAAANDADNDEISYAWDFGDGATANGANAAHTYTTPGTYAAKVTATDATGKSSQKTVQVIARRPCAAAPTADEGYALLFNGRDLTGWRQSGPGGFTVEDCEMTSFGGLGMLWYSGKQFQDYSLKLQFKLSDDTDNSGVFTRFPDPGNDPFVAVNRGHEVQIREGTASDGEPQKTGSIYNFDREDARNARPIGEWNDYEIRVVGQTYTMFLNGQKVNEYTSDGSRGTQGFIGLQNHGAGDKVSLRTVQIKELDVEQPFVNTLSGDKVRGPAPLTVNYTADAVDRQGDAVTYEWDFGVPGTDEDKATGKNASYTYTEGGTYTATVTPVDAKGNRGMTREAKPVTVEVEPVVTASADPSCGPAPLAVKFSGSARDPQGQNVTYRWDFGVAGTDADTSNEQNPSYTYEQVGSYKATLTATDPDGNRGSMEVPITVRADGQCVAAVNLNPFFNNDAISTHLTPADGNFDAAGWSFAAETLPAGALPEGGVVNLSGVPYQFPSPADGKKNSVEAAGQTIPLPSGRYGKLMVLASSHHGDSLTNATVTYADGSTAQIPLRFTDWAQSPKHGDKAEIAMPHRHDAGGDTAPPVNIFSQAVPIDATKGVQSIKLPNEAKLHVFAMTATDAGTEEPPPPLSRGCNLSDDFEGASLDKDLWNRITREDQSLYGLSGGNLVIQTGAGEVQDTAPNLIMQSVPEGARTYTTKLTMPTTAGGQQGGIVLANPEGNGYMKLAFVNKGNGNKWVEFLRIEPGTNQFTGVWNSGGQTGDAAYSGPFLPADFGDTVHLRLSTTDGQTYKGEFSKDGQDWKSAGDDRRGFGATDAVGLYALRGGQGNPVTEASFDSFDVTPDKPCATNEAPTVTASAEPTSGEAPLPVNFSADGQDPDGGDLAYEWDFGVEGTDADAADTANATYTYEEAGTYTATVTATDDAGATANDTVEVAVTEPEPGDTTAPVVRGLSPNDGSRTRDRTPTIQAIARDEVTDLAKADLELYVDGKRVSAFDYFQGTDRLRWVPGRQMDYGRHTVRVVAEDAAGNRAGESWDFRVVRP